MHIHCTHQHCNRPSIRTTPHSYTHKNHSLHDHFELQELVRTVRARSTIAVFRQLYSNQQAQLESLQALEHRVGPIFLSGHVATQGLGNKTLQFVYLNRRLLLGTPVHKLVNNLLGSSAIAGGRAASPSIDPPIVKAKKYGKVLICFLI